MARVGKCFALTAAVVAVLNGGFTPAEIIFESAMSGPTGQTSGQGVTVSDGFFLGTKFQITSTVTIGSIGCHLIDFDDGAPVFGAIVALTGQFDFPDSPGLTTDDVLGATLLTPPDASDNVAGNLRLTLTPGWYSVLFGSARFGAAGEAGAMGNQIPNGTPLPYTIVQSSGQIVFQNIVLRLYVDSEPVPVFRKVVDTATSIQGSPHLYMAFGPPSTRDGYVAYYDAGPSNAGDNRTGIYRSDGEVIQAIANAATLIPGNPNAFTQFGPYVSTSKGDVVFEGGGTAGFDGVYIGWGDPVELVADENTLIPGGEGEFTTVSTWNAIEDGFVVLPAVGTNGQQGIYSYADGELGVVADLDTPFPGLEGNVDVIPLGPISTDRGRTAFRGGNLADVILGLFVSGDNGLTLIADSTETIPGGTLPATWIGYPALRKGNLAYVLADESIAPDEEAVVKVVDGVETIVATLNTPVPGGDLSFTLLEEVRFDGRFIAILGRDSDGGRGIYTDATGELTKVIRTGDRLDNKTVGSAINSLGMGLEAIDARRIAFEARFSDGSRGIYLAAYPTPPGDAEQDDDVDLADVARSMNCFSESHQVIEGADCASADANGDTDVDLADHAATLACLGGPFGQAPCEP